MEDDHENDTPGDDVEWKPKRRKVCAFSLFGAVLHVANQQFSFLNVRSSFPASEQVKSRRKSSKFQCSECGKICRRAQALREHMASHSGERVSVSGFGKFTRIHSRVHGHTGNDDPTALRN